VALYPPQLPTNIAYEKEHQVFTPASAFMQFHSSKAVDGDTSPGSGFPLKPGIDRRFNVESDNNSFLVSI